MMQNFESHPVTREFDSGPDASNLSGALGGYGNLFSYIGFYSGEDPLAAITSYLKDLKFQKRILKTKNDEKKIKS